MDCKSKLPIYKQIEKNQRFGSWTATEEFKKRGSSWYVVCICDCGLKSTVLVYDLYRGKSQKCKSCRTVERNLKHGQNCHDNITYEYRLWQNLKHKKLLCTDWDRDFKLFFKDVGKRPEEGFILLRKNTNFLHSISNSFWGCHKIKFFKDLEGKKFGMWTVLEKCLISKGIKYLCICQCGKKDYITQTNLINGISTKCKSCSMIGKNKFLRKKGISRHSLYRTWHSIKDRCYRVNHKNYIHYGGRGIKMCDRWLNSFENFVQDMGEKPTKFHSIDRINNDGDYAPENCRWATQDTQCLNRRKIADLQNQINKLKPS